jgi:hypothetical protein
MACTAALQCGDAVQDDCLHFSGDAA